MKWSEAQALLPPAVLAALPSFRLSRRSRDCRLVDRAIVARALDASWEPGEDAAEASFSQRALREHVERGTSLKPGYMERWRALRGGLIAAGQDCALLKHSVCWKFALGDEGAEASVEEALEELSAQLAWAEGRSTRAPGFPAELLALWRRAGRDSDKGLDDCALCRFEEAKALGFQGDETSEEDCADFSDAAFDAWEDARAVAYVLGVPRAFTLGAVERRRSLRATLTRRGVALPEQCSLCEAFVWQGEPELAEVADRVEEEEFLRRHTAYLRFVADSQDSDDEETRRRARRLAMKGWSGDASVPRRLRALV